MSHNITSLKLQYYPTDSRICDFFTFLHFEIQNVDLVNKNNYWKGTDEIKLSMEKIKNYEEEMISQGLEDYPRYDTYMFQKDVIENRTNYQDFPIQHTSYRYNPSARSNQVGNYKISIFDLFAGEGEWLVNYQKFATGRIPHIKTFGIELSPERAETMKNKNIDFVVESAYEDVEVPKESCSLLLFNPPYGNESSKERLTKNYLMDIVNREILIPNYSFVDFVIRVEDFKDCLDILLNHFSIYEDTMYLAPQDEYNKFKQLVFTAQYKSHKSLLSKSKWQISQTLEDKKNIMEKTSNLLEINVTKISLHTVNVCRSLHTNRFIDKMSNLSLKNRNKEKVSVNGDAAWKWFEGLTTKEDTMSSNLIVPKELKKGELVNIMSSGFLNGQIENHVISGGTKQVIEEKSSLKQTNSGNFVEQIESRKVNKSFLNILLPDGTIKSLMNEEVGEE